MAAGIQDPLAKIVKTMHDNKVNTPQPKITMDFPQGDFEYSDGRPDKKEKKFFYIDREGKKKDERRVRHGVIKEQGGQDGPTMKGTFGPSVTEIPITYDESRIYAREMMDMVKENARRERAGTWQAYAGTVFTMVATSLLIIGVYKGTQNDNYNHP